MKSEGGVSVEHQERGLAVLGVWGGGAVQTTQAPLTPLHRL